jgi:hypothetical protein
MCTAVGTAVPTLDPAGLHAKDNAQPSPCHQYYPNIPGKVLLENDKVVVQRFTFPPGQWEGVHSHPPDQLYIHIKGGKWTVRNGARIESGWSETGSVGWYGPVDLSEDHESVNSGDEPIDLIWVTLKSGCAGKE